MSGIILEGKGRGKRSKLSSPLLADHFKTSLPPPPLLSGEFDLEVSSLNSLHDPVCDNVVR